MVRKNTSKMPKRRSPKEVQEEAEHARLKKVLRDIMRTSGFKVDSEIKLNFSGSQHASRRLVEERSIDIAALVSSEGKSFLLVYECKSGADLKEIHKQISSWEADLDKIQKGIAKVISSEKKLIKRSDFAKLDEVRMCYVFGKTIERKRYNSIASTLRKRGFYAWDNSALAYYKTTASTMKKAIRYEILREFHLNLESSGLFVEEAIQIRQGKLEMFVFGAKPSVLIKIGYVYRRASGKPQAYQRILNRDRIAKINDFLSSRYALLPNAIIIAFDEEPEIQKDVKYEQGKLYFPSIYCSAWIIDGQHRVYGFLNTPFEKIDGSSSEKVFKLPVVAFKRLDPVLQNRTFVSINYNQKKIDPTLLCDLATALPDLQYELTWPSLLVAELNKAGPLQEKVKISELDEGKPISISSFARYGLLESLLGYDKKKRSYNGALNTYAPFKPKATLANPANKKALNKQADLLRRYFEAVRKNTTKGDPDKDPWHNTKRYSLLKPTGINALLLVLSRIMEKYPKVESDIQKGLDKYLSPLSKVHFTREFVAKQGGGWKGFRNLANVILTRLNDAHSDSLRLYGEKEK